MLLPVIGIVMSVTMFFCFVSITNSLRKIADTLEGKERKDTRNLARIADALERKERSDDTSGN